LASRLALAQAGGGLADRDRVGLGCRLGCRLGCLAVLCGPRRVGLGLRCPEPWRMSIMSWLSSTRAAALSRASALLVLVSDGGVNDMREGTRGSATPRREPVLLLFLRVGVVLLGFLRNSFMHRSTHF
jgi:hypothetical protein